MVVGLLDLPAELLSNILESIPKRENPYDEIYSLRAQLNRFTILTTVNQRLFSLAVRLIWHTVDNHAIRILFTMLHHEDLSAGWEGQLTPRQIRFRMYVEAVHAIELDSPRTTDQSIWPDLETSSEPDAGMLAWRAIKYFPSLQSVSAVLVNRENLRTFIANFLRCIPPSLTAFYAAIQEGQEEMCDPPYDASITRDDLEELCLCVTTTFSKTLRTLSIITSGLWQGTLGWGHTLSDVETLMEFRCFLTGFETLGQLSELPALATIHVAELRPPEGLSIQGALWAGRSPFRCFQALQRLSFSSWVNVAAEFLELISTSPMKELHLRVRGGPENPLVKSLGIGVQCQPEMLRRLGTAIGRFAPTMEDLNLDIYETISKRANPRPVPWTALNAIYSCHHMKTFNFSLTSGATIALTDQDLEAMAISWPDLRKLLFQWQPVNTLGDGTGVADSSALTVRGLEPFSRHCLLLQEFRIPWLKAPPPTPLPPFTTRPRPALTMDIRSCEVHANPFDTNRHDERAGEYIRRLWPQVNLQIGPGQLTWGRVRPRG